GRCLADELLDGAPPPLRRDHQWPVLHEAAGIAEVVDVLARRALSRFSAAGDGRGPGVVASDGLASKHLGEVGSNGVEVARLFGLVPGYVDVALLDDEERLTGQHGVAHGHDDAPDDPTPLRRADVLHP